VGYCLEWGVELLCRMIVWFSPGKGRGIVACKEVPGYCAERGLGLLPFTVGHLICEVRQGSVAGMQMSAAKDFILQALMPVKANSECLDQRRAACSAIAEHSCIS
jgi:hypothetical protein